LALLGQHGVAILDPNVLDVHDGRVEHGDGPTRGQTELVVEQIEGRDGQLVVGPRALPANVVVPPADFTALHERDVDGRVVLLRDRQAELDGPGERDLGPIRYREHDVQDGPKFPCGFLIRERLDRDGGPVDKQIGVNLLHRVEPDRGTGPRRRVDDVLAENVHEDEEGPAAADFESGEGLTVDYPADRESGAGRVSVDGRDLQGHTSRVETLAPDSPGSPGHVFTLTPNVQAHNRCCCGRPSSL
jgi:hypothetical protein